MAVAVANCLPGLQWEEACRQRRLLKIVARSLQTVDSRVQTEQDAFAVGRLGRVFDTNAANSFEGGLAPLRFMVKSSVDLGKQEVCFFFLFLFFSLLIMLSVFLCRLLPVTALIAF